MLTASIRCAQGQDADVEQYDARLAEGFDANFAPFDKLVVAYGQDDGGIFTEGRRCCQALQTVFVLRLWVSIHGS